MSEDTPVDRGRSIKRVLSVTLFCLVVGMVLTVFGLELRQVLLSGGHLNMDVLSKLLESLMQLIPVMDELG